MIAGEAIMRALKGVVSGELGTVRTTAGLFHYHPGFFEQDHDPEDSLFEDGEHIIDIVLGNDEEHPSSPLSSTGSRHIARIPFTFPVLSVAKRDEQRHLFQARVMVARSQLCNALGFQNNLRFDDRGVATGIAGGCLSSPSLRSRPEGSTPQFDCNLARWSVVGVAAIEVPQEVA